MKKILLATSILAATTGFAAAEVALTGDARMGVVYDGNDVQFSQRARVQFNLSGQTDTGLEFGASFRAHEANDAQKGGFTSDAADRESTVWISGAFGKLAMGDVNSAAEEAFGDLSGVGFSGLSDISDIPYINGDGTNSIDQGPGALYTYATGAFEFHLGMTDGNRASITNGAGDLVDGPDRDTTYSIAAAYSADTFKIGLGYLDNGNANPVPGTGSIEGSQPYTGSQWIIYGSTEFAGVGVKAYYTDFDDVNTAVLEDVDGDQMIIGFASIDKSYGLSLDYAFGATTITGFARRDEISETNADGLRTGDNVDSFGLGAAYDLGGGASLHGGVVDTDTIGNGETIADFGIKLRF